MKPTNDMERCFLALLERVEAIEKRMDDYNVAVDKWRDHHKEQHVAIKAKYDELQARIEKDEEEL